MSVRWITEIEAARRRIANYVRVTPLEFSPFLSRTLGAEVFLKLENLQATGSFKARGAVNAILCLSATRRKRDIVVASTGNHGIAAAYALSVVGGSGIVFVPKGTLANKVAAIRQYGMRVVFQGNTSGETEAYARRYATRRQMTYVSPYNDLSVIAGQGTIGLEIAEQSREKVDVVISSVGGGGLVAGVGSYLKARQPKIQIVGASPAASPALYYTVRDGSAEAAPEEPTLSDGTAGGLEPDAITIPLCKKIVDDWALVDESAIEEAVRQVLEWHSLLIEGAAGVAVAAAARKKRTLKGKRVAIVICGGRLSTDKLRQVLGG